MTSLLIYIGVICVGGMFSDFTEILNVVHAKAAICHRISLHCMGLLEYCSLWDAESYCRATHV